MSLFGILAAFGGGLFAAVIGPLPSFIMTGVFAIAGSVAGMCGAADACNILINYFAFGCFFGPHISFLGGTVASGYAHKIGLCPSGQDITIANVKYNRPDVLLVGGVTGVCGYLFKELVWANLFAGTISARLVTDGPSFTILVLSIAARLILGGPMRTSDRIMSKGKELATGICVGISYSLLVSGLYVAAIYAGVPEEAFGGVYNLLVFGIAAVGLIFFQAGQAYYACQHIVIVAATATMKCYSATGSLTGALLLGVLFGLCTMLIGDIEANMINCGDCNHIDNAATSIFIMMFVINAIFPG